MPHEYIMWQMPSSMKACGITHSESDNDAILNSYNNQFNHRKGNSLKPAHPTLVSIAPWNRTFYCITMCQLWYSILPQELCWASKDSSLNSLIPFKFSNGVVQIRVVHINLVEIESTELLIDFCTLDTKPHQVSWQTCEQCLPQVRMWDSQSQSGWVQIWWD